MRRLLSRMLVWAIAAVLGVVAAAGQYSRLTAPAGARAGLAALRTGAITLILALLLNAPFGRPRPMLPWIFVDASRSMTRGKANLWAAAWDTVRRIRAESAWVFGDSVRRGDRRSDPTDAVSRLRPVADRTLASGRPVLLITDGEVQDSSALDGLATGSRVIVLERPPERDAAVASIEAPRAAVGGDSLMIRVTLAAGSQGASQGSLSLQVDEIPLGDWRVEPMSPWAERQYDLRPRAPGIARAGILRAIVHTAGDAEPRNDTLSLAMEISRAASAVFVSTSPDEDARFAIAVLRGALALPTEGFFRVAPDNWRHEGSLAPTTEVEVRQAIRQAPIAVIHGDTGIFGPPRQASVGPVALLVPPETEDGEWYPSAVPASPLSSALSTLPLDSLPPISVGQPAAGDWIALEARRGRQPIRRPVVVGRDGPRRGVTVTGAGLWRWRFRGGASADAYVALMGSIFDWLAAERADRRGAMPEESSIRAGQPIRWRRGSAADSVVRVVLQRRLGNRADTLTLRFAAGSSVFESAPLQSGVYDVTVPGGRTLLVVNQSAELLPSRPRLQSGNVGRRARSDDSRGARSVGWLYAVVIMLLALEWLMRRRLGLR